MRGKVALVGSPSTGKSTIFNRIIGERKSIVSEEHGITRDRLYAEAEWLGETFTLIDTGGLEIVNAPFQKEIRAQVEYAIDEADVIIFLVDGKAGLTANDDYVRSLLFKVKKKVVLACNKIDDVDHMYRIYDFYSLGFGEPIAVSGAHGIGLGDLLDKVVKMLPKKSPKAYDNAITFTFIGRPNVGKSSLTNAVLGSDRVIVSNIEGTTRDAIDQPFKRDGINYVAIDTAGLKKRGKIYEAVDKYAALRAMDAIERASVVCLLVDASTGIYEQDKHVVGYAIEQNKPIVIVVNKWDLHSHEPDAQQKFTEELRILFKFVDYAPIVYLSAKNRSGLKNLFDAIDKCFEDSNKRVPTAILNEVVLNAQIMNQAPDFNGGRLKISYVSQVKAQPPTFVFFVNNPKFLHFSYERYIDNTIRRTFNLDYTPLKFVFKSKNKEVEK
ncbi:MAG TPA: ribosome biogenesis GTPase Der [Firmicutes bacterium]|jgi:ribosome-associated GTPase engA|nr:gTPase Der [Clostridium sp. CAG:288]HAR48219.1 ribosome biogenesis GTPase Der [Bacillota bacterium]HAX00031.1 ribosome biogenesis GTPase Der [Bacillota bacterium]HCY68180.1 ribosome biogenesis GTPase Der [Bacillota bacterium]